MKKNLDGMHGIDGMENVLMAVEPGVDKWLEVRDEAGGLFEVRYRDSRVRKPIFCVAHSKEKACLILWMEREGMFDDGEIEQYLKFREVKS